MNLRYLGTLIMILSVFLALIVNSLSSAIIDSLDMGDHCSSVNTCPHVATLNFSYIGYIFSLVLFSIGGYLFMKTPIIAGHKKPKNLEPDENKIFEMISEAGGMIFQGDIVEKSGFNKARVTRILDRLEGKGVLDRRRRGMTNAVVLK